MAMFGLTAGAICVYLYPQRFPEPKTKQHMTLSALLFAISIVLSFMTQLCLPFVGSRSIMGLYLAGLLYSVAALPFCFSGICLSLAFTRHAERVGLLYAADLAGAALGCVVLVVSLSFADGPSTIFITASIAALGAFVLSQDTTSTLLKRWSLIACLLLGAFALINAFCAHNQKPLITFLWSNGTREVTPLYEKWNSFSRITVKQDSDELTDPHGWGLSPTFKPKERLRQLWLNLDSTFQTPVTEYTGDLKKLDFLKYDLCNFVYYLRKAANTLVIGVGGGRDVLSALCCGASAITAVDINPDIIATVNGRFGELTGHLDRDPKIRFIAEDARTYTLSAKDLFDVIQISVIDTGVLSTNGALTLTENSLYTVEAWVDFIKHLKPDGILSCVRWYSSKEPGEAERLVSTARAALLHLGVRDPREHIVVVRTNSHDEQKQGNWDTAVILVSKEPFSKSDLTTISDTAGQLKFVVSLSPDSAETKAFSSVADGTADGGRALGTLANLDPVTDDSPFFFYMLRPLDIVLHPGLKSETLSWYVKAEFIVVQLLIAVVGLTILCLLAPLWTSASRAGLKESSPFLLYFTAIGFGYILIEISQMQRLTVFLGHPTYSLTVVLFTMLLASSIGSYLTNRISKEKLERETQIRLVWLLVAMLIYGMGTPMFLDSFRAAAAVYRIIVASAILFPLGLFMGMAFPLGLKLADREFRNLTPWFWGLNGAASVCATVLSVVIAISSGITTTFAAGAGCYLLALLALVLASKRRHQTCCESHQPEGAKQANA